MTLPRFTLVGALALTLSLGVAQGASAQKTPGYNNKIPESILTPGDLETRIGTFRYFDG